MGEERREMTVEKLLTEVQVQKISSLFVLVALGRNGEKESKPESRYFF